jgi:hypothetical protein
MGARGRAYLLASLPAVVRRPAPRPQLIALPRVVARVLKRAPTQLQVQRGLLLDFVVRKSAAILEQIAPKDQVLLFGGNAP